MLYRRRTVHRTVHLWVYNNAPSICSIGWNLSAQTESHNRA